MTVISGPFVDEIVSMMIKSDGLCVCGSPYDGAIVFAGKRWGVFVERGQIFFYDEMRGRICHQHYKEFAEKSGKLLIQPFPDSFDETGKTTVSQRSSAAYIVDGGAIFGERVKEYRSYSLENTARRAQAPLAAKRQWPGNAAFALWCKTGILCQNAEEILAALGKWFPPVICEGR